MTHSLSKLQIRSELFNFLNNIESYDELSGEDKKNIVCKFKEIENRDDVVELILKEFTRINNSKLQILTFLLIELAELEKVKNVLWDIIVNPKIQDYVKEQASITLKGLGDNFNAEEFLSYLSDPQSVVDKETQRLLEIAAFNPDAQIDFLDFLFSLQFSEQQNLVNSLKVDYSADYLANVLVPALISTDSFELKEFLMKNIAETKSQLAVKAFDDIAKYSNDEKLRRFAGKILTEFKLAGINIQEALNISPGAEICSVSAIYKCFSTICDGTGSKAVIVSRKKENGDILLLCAVVNDTEGILDCFGFNGITEQDFNNILNRVQADYSRIEVPVEYCKLKLEAAELINKQNQLSISYEYLAWKSLISDVQLNKDLFSIDVSEWSSNALKVGVSLIFEHPDFDHWFFEEDDSDAAKKMLNDVVSTVLSNVDVYLESPKNLIDKFTEIIDENITKVFDQKLYDIFKLRLQDTAYMFNFAGLDKLRNLAATSYVYSLETEISDNILLKLFARKSIFEALLRYQAKYENKDENTVNLWNSRKKNVEKKEASFVDLGSILDILEEGWTKDE